jgi:heme a synthase
MAATNSQTRTQIIWLLSTALLLWLMIMLGGATRLTKSGLSIVEWRPLTGIIPPLTDADWWAQFQLYQQYPEYKKINLGMSLSEFKFIFMMEYLHRLLGRIIGLWFFIPLVWFAIKRTLDKPITRRLSIVFALGAFQGFFGWYMVKSGLVDNPSVSHYRLTGHLSLAIVILSMILWTAFSLMKPTVEAESVATKTRPFILTTCLLIGATIIYGALVSGLKAGLIYNTYPLMGGQFIPDEWLDFNPTWLNFIENPTTVQWIHRWIAMITVLAVGHSATKLYLRAEDPSLKRSALLFLGAGFLQLTLGIMTLIHQVPVSLGVLHQGNAIVLLCLGLWVLWQTTTKSPERPCARASI